jgi:hypothetical protein
MLQIERDMGALDRFRHLSTVIKRLAEPAVEFSPLAGVQRELIQLRTAGFEFARGDCALQTLDICRSRALVTHPNGAFSHMGRQAVQTLPENLHLREYLAVSSKPRRRSVRLGVQSKNSLVLDRMRSCANGLSDSHIVNLFARWPLARSNSLHRQNTFRAGQGVATSVR